MKKVLKRRTRWMLVLVAILIFAGCGKKTDEANTTPPPTSNKQNEQESKKPQVKLDFPIRDNEGEYGINQRVAFIPKFVAENGESQAIDEINAYIEKTLHPIYQEYKQIEVKDDTKWSIISYPIACKDYVQVVTTCHLGSEADLKDGDLVSITYDIADDRLISLNDMLAKEKLTEEKILDDVYAVYQNEADNAPLDDVKIVGFCYQERDGKIMPTILLKLYVHFEETDEHGELFYRFVPQTKELTPSMGALFSPVELEEIEPPLWYPPYSP
ncbi:MAG: hypothetical protein Q4D65_09955 [Peptostreptococcaceae bacterium]|nr:hypothetical protein [Peptostreptococcaceae bacterium]